MGAFACRQLRAHIAPLARGPEMREKVLHREGHILDTSSSFASLSRAPKRSLTEAEIPEHLPELRLITSVMYASAASCCVLVQTVSEHLQC